MTTINETIINNEINISKRIKTKKNFDPDFIEYDEIFKYQETFKKVKKEKNSQSSPTKIEKN